MVSSEQTSRRAFLVLVVLSIAVLFLIITPFAQAFFLAAVLAGALHPIMEKLTLHAGKRRGLAAGFLVAGVVIVLLAPLTGLAAFVVSNITDAMRFITQTVRSEGMAGLIHHLPGPLEKAVEWVIEKLPSSEVGVEQRLNEQVTAQGTKAAAAVSGVLSATGTLVIQAVMMLIAFYFLLVDGPALVDWIEQISPLKPGQTKEILAEFRKTSVSVLLSTVATSGVQAVAALIGYFIARVPHPFVFALLTFFIAFVPAIGAAGVCLVAAALLLATGHTVGAIFLAIWALAVVGLVDNIVKPLIARRGMDMHGAVVFFALLGGLAAFGTVGLLAGPLGVAFFLAVVRIWHRDYGRGPQAARAVAEATEPGPLPKP